MEEELDYAIRKSNTALEDIEDTLNFIQRIIREYEDKESVLRNQAESLNLTSAFMGPVSAAVGGFEGGFMSLEDSLASKASGLAEELETLEGNAVNTAEETLEALDGKLEGEEEAPEIKEEKERDEASEDDAEDKPEENESILSEITAFVEDKAVEGEDFAEENKVLKEFTSIENEAEKLEEEIEKTISNKETTSSKIDGKEYNNEVGLKDLLKSYSLESALEGLYSVKFTVEDNKNIKFSYGTEWNYIGDDMDKVSKDLGGDTSLKASEYGSLTELEEVLNAEKNRKLKLSAEQLAVIYTYDPNGVRDYLYYNHNEELIDKVYKIITGKNPKYYSHNDLDGEITEINKNRKEAGTWEKIYSEADLVLCRGTMKQEDAIGIATMIMGSLDGLKYGDSESEEASEYDTSGETIVSSLIESFKSKVANNTGVNIIKNYLGKSNGSVFGFVRETKDLGNSIEYKLRNPINGMTEVKILKSELTEEELESSLNGCFTGDTVVITEKGLRRIDNIEEGEKVYAEDEKTGETNLKRVIYVYKKETKDIIIVKVGKEEIETTRLHRFYTKEEGFKIAAELKNR